MSYYRAALAAAATGNKTAAIHLVQYSIAINEDAPSAMRLLELLQSQTEIDANERKMLSELAGKKEHKKALKTLKALKINTSKAHVAQGLLLALIGRKRAACKELYRALELDTGNEIARQALGTLDTWIATSQSARKRGFSSTR